jgi:hypothetical protein
MSTEFSATSCQALRTRQVNRPTSTLVSVRTSGTSHRGATPGSGWCQNNTSPLRTAVGYDRTRALRLGRSA